MSAPASDESAEFVVPIGKISLNVGQYAGLLIAMAGQVAAGSWFIATLNAQVNQIDRRLAAVEESQSVGRAHYVTLIEKMSEMKGSIDGISRLQVSRKP